MEQVELMKLLADPTRLKLLKLLLAEELCVCELQELLQISQPAVSQHMARLWALGLVTERKEGPWTYYRGDLAQVIAGLQGMINFLSPASPPSPAMAELYERRARLNRKAMCKD